MRVPEVALGVAGWQRCKAGCLKRGPRKYDNEDFDQYSIIYSGRITMQISRSHETFFEKL